MRTAFRLAILAFFLPGFFQASAQRQYVAHSVLAAGEWYRISVSQPGVCRLDLAFLGSLGLNTSGIASSAIRLYGRPPGMLSEANSALYADDLTELAIEVADGGDGVLNGPDYILFYAAGPDQWMPDPADQRFSFRKNLYSREQYFYLRVGGTGKRVATAPLLNNPAQVSNTYAAHYAYETDSLNFLNGGKEWVGEEFANAPGKVLTQSFTVPLSGIQPGAPLIFSTRCVARSAGAQSRFDIQSGNLPLLQLPVNAITGNTYDPVARAAEATVTIPATGDNPVFRYNFVPGSFNAQGWLDRFTVETRCSITMSGNSQLLFRDWALPGGVVSGYAISNPATGIAVWDITDPLQPVRMPGQSTGTAWQFNQQADRFREYIAFGATGYVQPKAAGRVPVQDLHDSRPADLLIITHPSFLEAAGRIALFHQQQDQLRTVVVTTEQVYHEFAGGIPDPAALRDFVKMYFDRYGQQTADKPRYLLLFGDASFDYGNRVPGNTNYVPGWQTTESLDPLGTYTSDDFFGFLEDTEDISSGLVQNTLDIGIGRVPVSSAEQARQFADKLEAYVAPASFGPWRTRLSFVADDEDGNLHLSDAEQITAAAAAVAPVFSQQKIYLDAYPQLSGAGGSSYPDVNQALNNQVINGNLLINYNGHGGAERLAAETILDKQQVNSWNNTNRLPLFITATCDFAPYDNPMVSSLGEYLLLKPGSGAIALMTTTRPVFAFSNRVMNEQYIRVAMAADTAGRHLSLGDAVKAAKNLVYQQLPDVANNRKFTLLGDPALTLAFPLLQVKPLRVNLQPVTGADTLRAGDTVLLEGEVTDRQGVRISGYNGYVYPDLTDKPKPVQTRGNDPGSPVTTFSVQQNSLFRGKFTVTDGRFAIRFKVPKDIRYQYGAGRLGLYAENGQADGSGVYNGLIIGGTGNTVTADTEGPSVRAWLNAEDFVNGGLTNQQPVLLLELADSSGINTTGLGLGHDLVATLDGDNNQFYILNDYFQSEADSYTRGRVRFQLPGLEPGPHTLRIKAWDVMNNASEYLLEFVAGDDEELVISRVLNYPNPFTTKTRFWLEHNKPGQRVQVQVQIMTITGRVIRSLQYDAISVGNRITDIEWDARDDFGNKTGRGVYIYKVRVMNAGKKTRELLGKLVVL